MEYKRYPEHLVFGLDIGTRSVVGTVGYRENNNNFIVVAQYMKEHETRAMIDGQIHDITKVADVIRAVKIQLEQQVGRKLTDVCIAAAGRILKTVAVKADYEFPSETVVNEEHIHSLDLIGVEKAYDTIRAELESDHIHYYCVGYSVIRYYLNDYTILKLEGHKANKISTELIATFLPDEVVDGLYAAVEKADLQVANLTLEPIAAINIAIPDKFRLLNIALVDVGAGTSDISITKDGSITAYGMIPYAGDEITEAIVQKYLVVFNEAEAMKTACLRKKNITFKDIMGIKHKITSQEVLESIDDTIRKITKSIADKIIELNGGKPVSAVFVVGGGGKITGFAGSLAEYLGLSYERVALRGEEVLQEITFLQEKIKKDPLLVTPIGICLNFYDQKNNFIFVNVNGERIKLYDNNKLTIVDAALQVGFPNEKLFPRRGKTIHYTINGTKRMVRGELGEASVVKRNGEVVGLSHPIELNDRIEIIESTKGSDAVYMVSQLPEYSGTISIIFNGKTIQCPKFVLANKKLVSGFYNIQDNDEIEILNYYTLEQILEFMDLEYKETILVNNMTASLEDKIYENFSIEYELPEDAFEEEYASSQEEMNPAAQCIKDIPAESMGNSNNNIHNLQTEPSSGIRDMYIIVNGESVKLSKKKNYIFVDIFDFYPFNLSTLGGSKLITTINGEPAEFTSPLKDGDVVELYWKS
ncbi:MAG: cell division FtsA domain-containing protein [Anaerocolumna aminovalerica]|uniref:cell division protein FtsA n=1 Tax=Anaerocolumna aminovalerica TaxID=1527 RepID=UPI002907B442|nr:cell division FtsA domain-containing protein [Anaerocolumna aminovalerica]MDU6263835.1 cell division FtsA domain-containing protein [Anaerocolumna aminovalerica]